MTEDQCSIVGAGREAIEGLFTCSLNELNRNLSFMKEEFGNPQRLGVCTSCVCKVFRANSNKSLFASFGEGGGRLIYHERYLQRFLKDYSNWLWFTYNSSLFVSFE